MSRRGAFITLTATLVIVFGLLALTQLTGTTPRLGLDLQGGFSVVLEAPAGTDPDVLDQAVEIMRRRIEALGDVQNLRCSVVGDRTVEVQLRVSPTANLHSPPWVPPVNSNSVRTRGQSDSRSQSGVSECRGPR